MFLNMIDLMFLNMYFQIDIDEYILLLLLLFLFGGVLLSHPGT